ncbi:MAG: hypothetical protein ACRD35_03695 [Candidatus Acidiferrales bacterium]
MKIQVSFHGLPDREPVERELRRQGARLEKRLGKFAPDLVDLHVSLARRARRGEPVVASLSLYLPPGQLHAREEASLAVVALKHACAELLRELEPFQAKLRGEDKLRRWRRRARRPPA